MFKDGAKVIPGNWSYYPNYSGIRINNTHLGVPVSLYTDQLVGKRIIGQTSGITAIVDYVLPSELSSTGDTVLYVQYASSAATDKESDTFLDGEFLNLQSDVITTELNDNFIPQGESFASTISSNSNIIGSSFSINDGVYFIRGYFVDVQSERILLAENNDDIDRFNVRIGFRILEEIVTSDFDESLTDNAKGFNNYAAPGADRFKLSVSLAYKSLTDFNDADFVELARVENDTLQEIQKYTEYDHLAA